jgi:hypothetical protein
MTDSKITAKPKNTHYDFDSLTSRQRDVLGLIACCQDQFHHPRTIKALLDRGLIQEYIEERSGALGILRVKRYTMDWATHMAWCQWCSDWYDQHPEEVAEMEKGDSA